MPFIPFQVVTQCDADNHEYRVNKPIQCVAEYGGEFFCADCVAYMNYCQDYVMENPQEYPNEKPIVWNWITKYWEATEEIEEEATEEIEEEPTEEIEEEAE